MRNIVVVTPTCVTQTMIQALVESLGGYWNAEETLDQGVVERGDAVVYIASGQDLYSDYEPHEIAVLTQLLGETPRAMVDIHIGHAEGSVELAEDVARAVIKRWGGFLDDNIQELRDALLQEGVKKPKPAC
jgi:hypothetical protein